MFESNKQLVYKEMNKNRHKKRKESVVNLCTTSNSLHSKSGHSVVWARFPLLLP